MMLRSDPFWFVMVSREHGSGSAAGRTASRSVTKSNSIQLSNPARIAAATSGPVEC